MKIRLQVYLLILVIFFITSVSALPLQVQNGTTVYYNNLTEANTTSETFVVLSTLPVITQNVSGNYSIHFQYKMSVGLDGVWQILKNDVQIDTFVASNTGYLTRSVLIENGLLNTTDIIEITGRAAGGSRTCFVDDAKIQYEYIVPIITFPVNNSVQTSRTVNITGFGISGNVQYQVSLNSDGSIPYIDGNSSVNYSGNKTLNAGLNYIRVRGLNVGINETNWTISQVIIYSLEDKHSIGGVDFNWSSNGTLTNATWNRGNNHLLYGLGYNSSFDSGPIWELVQTTCNVNNLTVSNGYLSQTNTTACGVHRLYPNTDNYTNTDILVRYRSNAGQGGADGNISLRAGIINHIQDFSATNKFRTFPYYDTDNSFYFGVLNPSQVIINTSTTDQISQSVWYNERVQTYNNGQRSRAKIWNDTSVEPDWQINGTNDTLTYGSVGFRVQNGDVDIDSFWVRPVSNEGTLVTTGNYLHKIIDFGVNKNANSYCYQGTRNVANVKVWINSSNDNVTWTGDYALFLNIDNNSCGEIPNEYKKRYVQARLNVSGTGSTNDSSTIKYLDLYSVNKSYIQGYVNDQDGSPVPNATVGYFGNWSLTNVSGYYNITDLPSGNRSVVAGKTGYNSSGYIFEINSSSYIQQNFTIYITSVGISNVFYNKIHNQTLYINSFSNISGYVNESEVPSNDGTGIISVQTGAMSATCNIVRKNINLTPQYYERCISMLESSLDYRLTDASTALVSYDIITAYEYIKNNITSELNSRFYNNIGSWEHNMTDEWDQNDDWGMNVRNTGYVNNHAMFEAVIEYYRYRDWGDNESYNRLLNLTNSILNQTSANGYINHMGHIIGDTESTTYVGLANVRGLELIRLGYVNQTFSDSMNLTADWVLNMQSISGDTISFGRSAGYPVQYIMMMASDAMSFERINERYRSMDRIWQKLNTYTCGNEIFCTPLHFYNVSLRIGWERSSARDIGRSLVYLNNVADYYDSIIYESPINLTNFDDSNGSGLLILNTEYYTIPMSVKYKTRTIYYNNSFWMYNGTGIYPLRSIPLYVDSANQSFPLTGEATTKLVSGTEDNWNLPYFNKSKLIDAQAPNWEYTKTGGTNWSNFTYNITTNSMWENFTNILLVGGGNLSYYNLSVIVMGRNVNVTNSFAFPSGLISNYSIPIDLLESDNITVETREISNNNLDLNWSRGTESLTIRNLSVVGGDVHLENLTDQDGWIQYGHQKRTIITGNVSDTVVKVSYDISMNTSNVYTFSLNQPPSVWSILPVSSFSTFVNVVQDFNITFTQNLDTIQWQVDNITQEWDNGTSTGSYTNSTAGIGTHEVNATGCNDQGCATQLWNWTVLPGGTVPNITNIIINELNTTFVFINYTVNQTNSTSYVGWSTTSPAYSTVGIDGGFSTYLYSGLDRNHSLSGLPSDTKIYYALFALNGTNNSRYKILYGEEYNFTLDSITESISSVSITTGNFYINNTWVNPITNFNYTTIKYSNGTLKGNQTINYLNVTYIPHYMQNLSVQTVSLSGIVNSTKVWLNVTIPNNPIILLNYSSSYSVVVS